MSADRVSYGRLRADLLIALETLGEGTAGSLLEQVERDRGTVGQHKVKTAQVTLNRLVDAGEARAARGPARSVVYHRVATTPERVAQQIRELLEPLTDDERHAALELLGASPPRSS